MGLFWVTDSNLGTYVEGQIFNQSPIVLQYTGSEFAVVTLVNGNLPPLLEWAYQSGYVLITGVISFGGVTNPYKFTYRVTEIDGNFVDKEFTLNVITSPVPVWLSPSDLGTFPENYSFNLTPLIIEYSAILGAKVILLNGSLPSGLFWKANNNQIVITGQSDNILEEFDAIWTFRIINPNKTISDRTFTLTITSLAIKPDWTGQPQELGYVGSDRIAVFSVEAKVIGSIPPTYSLVNPPTGMTINSITGQITFDAPAVLADSSFPFIVRATLETAFSDLECSVIVLTIPHIPEWVTPDDLIRVPQQEYVEFVIEAFDPDQNSTGITYAIVSQDDEFPFQLDSDGLIYGIAPTVEENTFYSIMISATNSVGTVSREFTFEVTQVNTLGVLTWNNPLTDILNIPDGRRVVFDVSATSTRTPSVKHGITGGQLPPGLLLDKMQGRLVGYIDYHMQRKDYWFDLIATDEVDTLVRTMHLSVTPNFGYQFMDIKLPVYGDVRQQWLDTNSTIYNDTNMIVNVAVESNLVSKPELSLIRGLDYRLTDPDVILRGIGPAIQRMDLSIGQQVNTSVDSVGTQLFFRSVIDPQNGAGQTADHTGFPPEIVPNNLENIRKAFIDECGFANAGGGSGASAVASINAEDGSIKAIIMINAGEEYINQPVVTINGKGSGAVAYAMTKINRMVVIDPGTDWYIGEQFFLDIGEYEVPAHLVVTDIFTDGGLKEVAFVIKDNQEENGCYFRVPAGKILIKNQAGKLTGVKFELSIDEIRVVDGGYGYGSDTIVDFNGHEQLDSWQSEWNPILPVALVNKNYANLVINNSQVNVTKNLDGKIWQTGFLVMEMQGAFWQGTTTFKKDMISWDGGTTILQETLTPVETIFDQNNQTFDLINTTFDIGSATHRDARDNWGSTIIDEGTTAFEFYATIFDAESPPRHSSTLVRKLVILPSLQISGNNIVDTKTVS